MKPFSLTTFSVGLFAAVIAFGAGAASQEATWRVTKASGEVSIVSSGAQPVALTSEMTVKPGDTIRTGQNGRALLVRGAESILVSSNSVIGLPTDKRDGLSTTIIQQAGSILLEVEKRNVKHFEVATPYLAAVVKGTQFRVTVDNAASQVDVLRGQVEVADYKSGQFALVKPDQSARVSAQGTGGLSIFGSGAISPVQSGTPRSPLVSAIIASNDAAPASDRPKSSDAGSASQNAAIPASLGSKPASWGAAMMDWAKDVIGLRSGKSRDEGDLTALLAFPAFVGFSVAIGAAAFRRKRKSKR